MLYCAVPLPSEQCFHRSVLYRIIVSVHNESCDSFNLRVATHIVAIGSVPCSTLVFSPVGFFKPHDEHYKLYIPVHNINGPQDEVNKQE